MVVAVSAISYASYLLLNLTSQQSGVILSAVLGGGYSSTATTVALAERASGEQRWHLFSGSILIASGVMYLRLTLLLLLFSRRLLAMLGLPFMGLCFIAMLGGWLWSRLPDAASGQKTKRHFVPRNPLELRVAFLFAILFVGLLVLTGLVITHLGRSGVYFLSGIVGLVDVDPFVLGMTQSAGSLTPISSAATSIVIAVASNNVVKGIYAFAFADRKTGRQSLGLLACLGLLGLTPLAILP